MAVKRLTNLTRQGLPILFVKNSAGDLEFRTLVSSEIINMDESRLSQYLLDLQTAGHIKIEASAASADSGWTSV